MIAELTGIRMHESKDGLFSENDTHMSYLPLAHSFERAVVYTMLSFGGKIGFYQGVSHPILVIPSFFSHFDIFPVRSRSFQYLLSIIYYLLSVSLSIEYCGIIQ